jgi:hypothetical protein
VSEPVLRILVVILGGIAGGLAFLGHGEASRGLVGVAAGMACSLVVLLFERALHRLPGKTILAGLIGLVVGLVVGRLLAGVLGGL